MTFKMQYLLTKEEYDKIAECLVEMTKIEDIIVIATDIETIERELNEGELIHIKSIDRIKRCIKSIGKTTALNKHRIREILHITSFYDDPEEES